MSLSIVVNCDRSVPYGTCAARLHTGAATEAEAYEAAERAGWDVGGGHDFCPAHSHRPTRLTPPTRLHPEETPNR
ncbi:hypothetical protein [Streptomyces sp. NBC_00842]|uniref:hypothetical protein n=1 Tax=Streptomyces sp. NBC_00842 TaxID=2975848 RepID=UPI0038705502|nr:hypothetical protein OH821_21960 [Streptomyces sp. NBC_00842]